MSRTNDAHHSDPSHPPGRLESWSGPLATGWLKVLLVVWALPWTILGVLLGVLAVLTGGRFVYRGIVWEFHGGFVTWLLHHVPLEHGAAAITLGHTVVGCSRQSLDACRPHELIHVAQYERWGPLFVPLYFGHALRIWRQGGNPYRDNPLEREAYKRAPIPKLPEA